MKYEIYKDKEDLYVLCISSIVVMVTRDITRIASEIVDDATNRLTNPKRVYEPAIIDIELSNKEINEDILIDVDANGNLKVDNGSLGKLFEL